MKMNFWKQMVSGLLAAACAASPLVIPASANALGTARIPGGTYLAEKEGENVFIERIWTYECPDNPGQKHTISFHNAAPTCTESDYIYNYCTLCGERELYVEKAALGHDYWLTSSENGVDTYTCSRCGDTYTEGEEKPAQPEEGTDPGKTDGGTGQEGGSGTNNGAQESCAHEWREKTQSATCTQAGNTKRVCSLCGAAETISTTPALGHSYTSRITRQPTGEEEGVRLYTCTRCGTSYKESIPRLPVEETANKTGNRDSGDLDMEKLSVSEITSLLENAPLTLNGDVFDVKPSVNAPYATGKVNTTALQAAVDRLNAMRRIAGLPSVTLDQDLSENAQYGAVLTAHNNALNHYPSQPADMDQGFYTQARSATSTSNLSSGRTLPGAVDAFMDDSDASNISSVGHRRWQLNPVLSKVGFGFAVPESGYGGYVVEKVFDKSGSGCDYDFISWPASGNFPAEIFDGQTAWSITLNPQLYAAPSKSSVTVTLTRDSDGKTWTFSAYQADGFFNVSTSNYGVDNCIIFRPDGVSAYEGSYTVNVQGLKTQNGKAVADFTYQVDFFNSKPSGQQSVPVQPGESQLPANQPAQPGQTAQGTKTPAFRDVPASHWASEAIERAVSEGFVNGYADGTFHPADQVTNAHFNAMLSRAFYPEDLENAQTGGSWWTPNVLTNQAHGILDGTCVKEQQQAQGSWGSQINTAINRYDMAQMMYNLLKDHNAQLPAKTALQAAQGKMADWQQIPEKYRDAVSACYALGLLNGQNDGTFGGGNNMNRAQGCVVISRLLDYLAG